MLLQIKFVQCKTWCKWGCHHLHRFHVSALFASLLVMCSPWGIILVTKITMQGVVYIKFEPYSCWYFLKPFYSCWYFFKPFCKAIFASYFHQKSAFLSRFGVNMHHIASLWIMLSVTLVKWFSLLVLNDRTFALCFPLKCHIFLFMCRFSVTFSMFLFI